MGKTFALPQAVYGSEIKALRQSMNISRCDFASLLGVSVKTIENWEIADKAVTGPVTFALKALSENPMLWQFLEIPPQEYPLRLIYKKGSLICSVIDADEVRQLVKVKNFTDNIMDRAFGITEHPSYSQFLEFLDSRCMPKTRDKLKLELNELGLPFYDPLLIIEKTKGKTADDLFEIEIVRKNDGFN